MNQSQFLASTFAPGVKAKTDGGLFPVKAIYFDEGIAECVRDNGCVFRIHYARVHKFLF